MSAQRISDERLATLVSIAKASTECPPPGWGSHDLLALDLHDARAELAELRAAVRDINNTWGASKSELWDLIGVAVALLPEEPV